MTRKRTRVHRALVTAFDHGHALIHSVSRKGNGVDDRRSQFLIAVGDLCSVATLASLDVEVSTADGVRVRGIPGILRAARGEAQVDDTGYARTFRIGARIVNLDEIVGCSICSP